MLKKNQLQKKEPLGTQTHTDKERWEKGGK